MITGIVTARREAVLQVVLRDFIGQKHTYNTVVDTGYNGWLTLPPATIAALSFRWQRFGRAILADGSVRVFNVYEGAVVWDGQGLTVDIDEMDGDALVGMSLLYGYELVLPVLDGATFTLRLITTP